MDWMGRGSEYGSAAQRTHGAIRLAVGDKILRLGQRAPRGRIGSAAISRACSRSGRHWPASAPWPVRAVGLENSPPAAAPVPVHTIRLRLFHRQRIAMAAPFTRHLRIKIVLVRADMER